MSKLSNKLTFEILFYNKNYISNREKKKNFIPNNKKIKD